VLTDTHCHLDFNWYDDDRPAVIERAVLSGVKRMLIPGITATSSGDAVALAESHPLIFAAIGVHPTEVRTWNTQTRNALRQLAVSRKVVAIGEIGLDYFREGGTHEVQRDILGEELALAGELGLPVILHLREEHDANEGQASLDLLKMLEGWVEGLRSRKDALADRPGVLHSFSGSLPTAQAALGLGFFIGVTGPVTFKNARSRQELVETLPLDRILIETDAPFLTPVPYRGQRNEPAFVKYIAEKIALIRSRGPEEIAAMTTSNAERLFSWGA